MYDFVIPAFISIILVITSTLIFYEVLRVTWSLLPRFRVKPRKRIIIIMMAVFLGHTITVWIYGFCYWILSNASTMGSLTGEGFDNSFFGYIYYSAATYSSLGLGDIFSTGGLRFITGVEVLNGLVLIGWSVSFTYLAMEKFWDLHPAKNQKK